MHVFVVSWWCVAFWHSFVSYCTGSERTIFPPVKGLVGQTLCKSYCTHLILLYRLMLTVVTMVATNQFPKDCVYLRTTTKLHLSKDSLQYTHVHVTIYMVPASCN
jgi:hypothetical protein